MNLFPWECFLINAAMLGRNTGGIVDNEADEHRDTPRAGSPVLWRQAESWGSIPGKGKAPGRP